MQDKVIPFFFNRAVVTQSSVSNAFKKEQLKISPHPQEGLLSANKVANLLPNQKNNLSAMKHLEIEY
jgi:hypothetical protein